MPAVSIIIPVYNVEKYLSVCLDSVKKQTLDDIEVIIVCDGPDSNHRICDAYAAKNKCFRVIKNINKGLGGARNVGLKEAKGTYIAFLDGDDWLVDNALEKLYYQAEKSKSDMILFHTVLTGENGDILKKQDYEFVLPMLDDVKEKQCFAWENVNFADILKIRQTMVPWNKFYRRDFLERYSLNFPENTRYEDNIFFFHCFFYAKRISIFSEKLYFYRQRANSLVHTNKDNKNAFDIIPIWREIKSFLSEDVNISKAQAEIFEKRLISELSNACASLTPKYYNDFLQSVSEMFDSYMAEKVRAELPVINQINLLGRIPLWESQRRNHKIRCRLLGCISFTFFSKPKL